MKKSSLFSFIALIAIVALIFTGCPQPYESEDDDGNNTEQGEEEGGGEEEGE